MRAPCNPKNLFEFGHVKDMLIGYPALVAVNFENFKKWHVSCGIPVPFLQIVVLEISGL